MATAAPSVDPAVLRSIEDHIRTDAAREMGGVLVGTLDDGVEVDAVIPALEASGPSDNISFTHKVWDEVREQVDREHPDKQIVGWYRSNAEVGAEVSEYDLFIQQRFFDDPGMVALMIDPETGEASWFAWRGGELEQIPVGDAPAALVEPDLDPEAVAAAAAAAALAARVMDAPEVEVDPEPEVEPDDGGAPGEPAVVAPAGARDRRGVAIVAALVVAAIVGAGYLLFGRDDGTSSDAGAPAPATATSVAPADSSAASSSTSGSESTAATASTVAASTVPTSAPTASTPPATAAPSTAPPPTAVPPPPPSTPSTPPADGSTGSAQIYVVQDGDTLWGLAERFYGNGSQYTLIVNANPGTTEDIMPGDTLQIPAATNDSRDAIPPSE